jgi:very-short-patch-repair endonuclease/predicted transcriptional regulator of viral defense system
MGGQKHPSSPIDPEADRRAAVWALVRRQHGVIARAQLLDLGMSRKAIEHRIAVGRLHPLWRGIYAVGRPSVGDRGRWMSAVLSCGEKALLSHRSAAALWGILRPFGGPVEVVVPRGNIRRRPGIVVRQRGDTAPTRRAVEGIPVTDVVTTLVDLATCVGDPLLLRAINQADHLDLIDAHELRPMVASLPRRSGLVRLRALLDEQGGGTAGTLLELRFLRLVRTAGLPAPEVQANVNGYRVDFYWPDLSLIVETDGPRDHRTPGQQSRDRERDQDHAAAGLTTLRFTEAQVRHESDRVRRTLEAVTARLLAQAGLRAERTRL